MNLPFRSFRWLPVLLTVSLLSTPIFSAAAADKDRDACARNLQTIWDGIQKYREQHKKLPLHLSELVPKFVSSPNVLICPVTRRTGEIDNRGFSDPKLTTSYIFEFSNHKAPGVRKTTGFTLRDWRQLQMGRVGSIVPVIRCLHHARVLNMSFDGKVYETAGDWEDELNNIIEPGSLSPKSLLAEAEFFATGIRTTRIKTIDIAKYYNVTLTDPLHENNTTGPSLRNFPKGRNKFSGIPFEVSGAIHLHGKGIAAVLPDRYPTNVTGIVVEELVDSFHFLIGAGYPNDPGQSVGAFTVHYEDGKTTEISINYAREVFDWFNPPPGDNQMLQIAWSGSISGTTGLGVTGRIYQFSWANPRAETLIKSIDFSSAMNMSSPFLLGLSVESP